MLVSTRPATGVELFPGPAAISCSTGLLPPTLTRFLASRGLIEIAQTLLRRQHRRQRPSRNDRNRFARGDDLHFIADANAIAVDEPFRQGELEFAGYARHSSMMRRVKDFVKDFVKDDSLTGPSSLTGTHPFIPPPPASQPLPASAPRRSR